MLSPRSALLARKISTLPDPGNGDRRLRLLSYGAQRPCRGNMDCRHPRADVRSPVRRSENLYQTKSVRLGRLHLGLGNSTMPFSPCQVLLGRISLFLFWQMSFGPELTIRYLQILYAAQAALILQALRYGLAKYNSITTEEQWQTSGKVRSLSLRSLLSGFSDSLADGILCRHHINLDFIPGQVLHCLAHHPRPHL